MDIVAEERLGKMVACLQTKLKSGELNLSSKSKDGRINSATNEDEILLCLRESGFDFDTPAVREWYDFSFTENGIFVPVNVKVTTEKGNDNLSCKLGIYYALTGKIPPFRNGVSWSEYFVRLKENLSESENGADYYFLVVNKTNLDLFFTSLKTLFALKPNGNNLPFQANWGANKTRMQRTQNEAKEFILSNFEKSLKERSEAFEEFKRAFYEA